MSPDHAGRLARAAEEAGGAGLDALIVAPSPDLVYLTGYDPPLLERLTALVVGPGREPVLLVPELERPRAASEPVRDLARIESWRDGEDPYEALSRLLAHGSRFGVSDRMWAVHLLGLERALPGAAFSSGSAVLARLRARKDPEELHLLGRAGRAADEAFHRVLRLGFEGRTEREVAAELARLLLETGHESVAFTIVASGPNAASPHHEPGARTIRRGDVVVLDFGGRVGGYCSDITRTVCVGEPSEEVQEVHEVVARAQEAAFRAVRPGVPAGEVDRAARRVVEESGYGGAFLHRTGHGIGLEEHEPPYIVEGNEEPLQPGMTFSIEPGVYLEGRFGVRIEDIVAVTEDGAVRLNHAPRELVAVA
ncbi:MAG TPA: Xaa-Pro peptidase family protein [Actinomycetota bacterium]|nr:Xaa-Pro peptidase family protein [Actinomycetota bacterium]